MATILDDLFNRSGFLVGSTASPTGGLWSSIATGNAGVGDASGNGSVMEVGGSEIVTFVNATTSTTLAADGTLTFTPTDNNWLAGVMLGGQGGGYPFWAAMISGGDINVYRIDDASEGIAGGILDNVVSPIAAGNRTSHTLKLIHNGAAFSVELDGVAVDFGGAVVDATYTTPGKFGMVGRSVVFDRLLAADSVAGDTTAPTLSSPTGTGGTATGTGGITSNEAGTHYWQATTSATPLTIPTSPAAMTGWTSRALTATAQTWGLGAQTAGTYFLHNAAEDATGNRTTTDVVSGSFVVAASGAATAVTLTGPSSGVVSVASASFTAGANGTITGTVTVTPSAGGGGGTFSPTSVAISSGTPTATFTYTPGTTGAKSISVTNNGSLSNPSAVTYTVSEAPAPGSGTLSLTGFAQWTGSPVVSVSVPFVKVFRISTGAMVLELTAQAISGAGAMSITNAALSPAVDYMVFGFNADGSASFKKKVTAS